MPTLRVSQVATVSVFSLLISGSWGLMSEYSQVQAQIPNNSLFLAQVVQPYIYEIPTSQQSLPLVQPMQPVEYNNPNNQNFERYFVYVDSSDSQTLQRVKQIESSAYIRNYEGRKIIQSGVFNGQVNALRRVRELESQGIYGARIVNSSNGEVRVNNSTQVASYNPYEYNQQSSPINNQQVRGKFYYVVIPNHTNNLVALGTEIRQKVNSNINVFRRNQPRGAHIAVGPFSDRSEAEQWNSYLKNSGYGNARIYYGR
ncbi:MULTISPECIES: hypothetical protein [unclassified Anabaena]|uniref:hypothetical protein n=1 Tax=unclassified Anabaena TaxID=2619674 RepID=UPI0014483386|nr:MULTISPECIES: hypothetical protein [unclassified Anabaena]MTJ09859.1 hypothetical protein [Anabaena sp. UHCC 0204]MTJ53581.1 hypothetical protein [Anabaena sp. UHCC 0253]